jgi:predicted DNA-binding transcriptional regulator AlpA
MPATIPKNIAISPAPERLVSVKEVCTITGAGRSWVFKKTAAREFPQPVRIGTRYTRWKAGDVHAWLTDPQRWIAENQPTQTEGVPA